MQISSLRNDQALCALTLLMNADYHFFSRTLMSQDYDYGNECENIDTHRNKPEVVFYAF